MPIKQENSLRHCAHGGNRNAPQGAIVWADSKVGGSSSFLLPVVLTLNIKIIKLLGLN